MRSRRPSWRRCQQSPACCSSAARMQTHPPAACNSLMSSVPQCHGPERVDLRLTAERSMMLTACRDPAEDVAAFRQGGGQVLIGTPGRLSDFMKRCAAVDTRRLEVGHYRSLHGSTCCDQRIESQLTPVASWTRVEACGPGSSAPAAAWWWRRRRRLGAAACRQVIACSSATCLTSKPHPCESAQLRPPPLKPPAGAGAG